MRLVIDNNKADQDATIFERAREELRTVIRIYGKFAENPAGDKWCRMLAYYMGASILTVVSLFENWMHKEQAETEQKTAKQWYLRALRISDELHEKDRSILDVYYQMFILDHVNQDVVDAYQARRDIDDYED